MDFPNPAQIHLAFNHLPVVLTAIGLVILIISLIRKNDVLSKTALWILLVAGLFSIPAYLSGEGAEHLIEDLPGISEHQIEEHEEGAKIAFILCMINALLAAATLFYFDRFKKLGRALLLIIGLICSILMMRTAHEGGLIRHPEIGKDFSSKAKIQKINEEGEGEDEHHK